MTTPQMLEKLQNYFNADAYSEELSSQLFDFIDIIVEKDRQKVYDRIVKERQYRSPVLVNDIRRVCDYLGVAFTKQPQAEKFRLTCEACEREYMFKQVVSDEEEEAGVYCRCPNCGLPGSDQLLAHRYAAMQRGQMPEWFALLCAHFRAETGPGGQFKGGRIAQRGPLVPVPVFKAPKPLATEQEMW